MQNNHPSLARNRLCFVNKVLWPSSRRQAALFRAAFDFSNLLCVNAIPNEKTTLRVAFSFGGLEEIRTPDPHNANVVRSQLRYKPMDYQ